MTLILSLLLIVNGIVPDEKDTSLDAVAAFGLTSQLVSGSTWFCSATLVRPDTLLLAKHCLSPYGLSADYSARFRRQTNGAVGSVGGPPDEFYHAHVVGLYAPAIGDVALALLNPPVEHISPIAMSFEDQHEGDPMILSGWGKEGPGRGEGPALQMKSCSSVLQIVATYYLTFPSAWNGGECGPNNNDSGGPAINEGGSVVGVVRSATEAWPLSGYSDDPQFNPGAKASK